MIVEEEVVVSFPVLNLPAHLLVQGQLFLDELLLGLGEDGVADHTVIVEFGKLVHGDAAGRMEARLGGLVVRLLQVVVAEGASAARRQQILLLAERRHKINRH